MTDKENHKLIVQFHGVNNGMAITPRCGILSSLSAKVR